MTDTFVEDESAEQPVQEPQDGASDEQLIAMLVDRVRTQGLRLTGEGGLLQQLTKRVLERRWKARSPTTSATTTTTRPVGKSPSKTSVSDSASPG